LLILLVLMMPVYSPGAVRQSVAAAHNHNLYFMPSNLCCMDSAHHQTPAPHPLTQHQASFLIHGQAGSCKMFNQTCLLVCCWLIAAMHCSVMCQVSAKALQLQTEAPLLTAST
jgi:hypothetical protein